MTTEASGFRKRLRAMAASLVIGAGALWGGQALAWGPVGHDVIVEVAYARLAARDPVLARKFDQILDGGDGLHESYTDKTGALKECRAMTRTTLANWPDCVRYGPASGITAAFHFDDARQCTTVPPFPPPDDYCEDGACGTRALERYIEALKAPQTSARDRAVALAFIIHIVGGLHQPRHAEDNDDRGGNAVSIALAPGAIPSLGHNPDNLHALWDAPLVFAPVGREGDAVPLIQALADERAKPWGQPNPDAWVAEAHGIARQAYQALKVVLPCDAGAFNGGAITAAYVSRFTPNVTNQLARASVRLTDLLARILPRVP